MVNIRNAGSFACKDVAPVFQLPESSIEKTAFIQWTAAYATAAARSNSLIDVFPIGDTRELLNMISFICRESPQAKFEAALRTALSRLRPFWIRKSPKFLTLSDPAGREVQYFTDAVKPLQQALSAYSSDIAVDGIYGKQTANIISQVHSEHSGQGWETPDGALLYLLTRPK